MKSVAREVAARKLDAKAMLICNMDAHEESVATSLTLSPRFMLISLRKPQRMPGLVFRTFDRIRC